MTNRSGFELSLLWLVVCLPVHSIAEAADAGSNQRDDKGIYSEVVMAAKEYHLIETSAEMHDQFLRRGLRYNDRELEGWIQQIGVRLAPKTTDSYQHYRFYIVQDPSPNAFALPDGQVYVHSGLISRLQNEAQLAALLAHEINHVAGHHGILAYRSQQKKAAAGLFFRLAGAATGGWGQLAGSLAEVGLYSSVFGYSRALEQEADARGFELMLGARYDVREMSKLFEILNQDFEGLRPRLNGKWSTHPDLLLRAEFASARADSIPESQLSELHLGREDFRSRVRPLALAAVTDYILDDYPRTALELSRDLVDENPDDALAWVAKGHSYVALGALTEYGSDLPMTEQEKRQQVKVRSKMTRDELRIQWESSPEAGVNIERNLAEAEKAYRIALDLDGNAVEAHAGLGEVYLRRGKYEDSARELMTYLKLRPQAPDRSVVMDDLRDLTQKIRAGTPDE